MAYGIERFQLRLAGVKATLA